METLNSSLPDEPKPAEATYRDGTFLLSPAQHREQAKMLRQKFPNHADAPQLAKAHEQLASVQEQHLQEAKSVTKDWEDAPLSQIAGRPNRSPAKASQE